MLSAAAVKKRAAKSTASSSKKSAAAKTAGAKKKVSPKAGAAKTPAAGTSKGKAQAAKTARRKGTPKRPRRAGWRSGQQQPTPERYKEIQQALIDKGYLEGSATGEWGPSSIEALKRFQQDQELEPDGKLSSLSLIALGLGPRREPSSPNGAIPPTPAAPEQPKPAP